MASMKIDAASLCGILATCKVIIYVVQRNVRIMYVMYEYAKKDFSLSAVLLLPSDQWKIKDANGKHVSSPSIFSWYHCAYPRLRRVFFSMRKYGHAFARKGARSLVGVACTRKIKKYRVGRRYSSATPRKLACQTSTSNQLAERTDSFTSKIDFRLRLDVCKWSVCKFSFNDY